MNDHKPRSSDRGASLLLIAVAMSHVLPHSTIARAQSSPDPYCGIHSLYAACKLAGKPVAIESLLQPKYLGSYEGSSLAELRQAALDVGLYAEPIQNLPPTSLASLGHSAILHVKASQRSDRYDHWLLCVRIAEDVATVIDGPRELQRISIGELATRWDGIALVVSASPIDMSGVQRHAFTRLARWVAVLLLLLLSSQLIGWLVRRRQGSRPRPSVRRRLLKSAAACIALVFVSAAAALAHHGIANSGFLKQPQAVAQIKDAHWADFVHKLSATEARALVGRPDVTFVDARFPGDFAKGHIKGAINVPVNVNDTNLRELLAKVPKEHLVILYCQSEACRFAKDLAPRLAAEGHVRQSLFTGGWREWLAHEKK